MYRGFWRKCMYRRKR